MDEDEVCFSYQILHCQNYALEEFQFFLQEWNVKHRTLPTKNWFGRIHAENLIEKTIL